MAQQRSLSDAGRWYITAVILGGLLVVVHSVYTFSQTPPGAIWFVWAGLTLLSGSFTVKVPSIPARLSASETFVFAAVLMFGPAAATLVVALDSLVISLWIHRTSRRSIRILFNLSAPTIAVWIAGQTFFLIAGITPLAYTPHAILPLLIPLVSLAVIYFLLNSWLIAFAVALEQRLSAFLVWRQNFLWLSLSYFSGASVAALLLPYLQAPDKLLDFLPAIGLLVPLLLISYLTLKTSLGRVEDATKHLSQLNRLYLSTIETLAMAIDAKDQITHGHIRRVQILAVRLAKAMGLADTPQIRAVEAAALLHDMGKLAVPEYILNKPGPLTPAEFEKMKLHASVGADILSAIDFPYPVVPIVRHHHENWDGTGYPDRLKGSDIPIGARILAVVDCFDALTSDRPYRSKLADADALRILKERRGTMYDPLVVDVFVRVYRDIAPSADEVLPSQDNLSSLSRTQAQPAILPQRRPEVVAGVSASTDEMLWLYEIARGLAGRLTLSEAAEIVFKHFRRLVPATTCVFFVYDVNTDELITAHAAGDNADHFAGIRIPMGQRLSGWVAANRQTILNSDPMLDLGEVARALKPSLRSCLSTPLVFEKDLVGVLTVYSTHRDAFTEEHQRIVELVGRQVSLTVKDAIIAKHQADTLRRQLEGLPSRQHFEHLGLAEVSAVDGSPCSVLLVDLHGCLDSKGQPRPNAEQFFANIAQGVRLALRPTDLLFRLDFGRVVVLLPHTERETAESVGERIMHQVKAGLDRDSKTGFSEVLIGRSTAPEDALVLSDLIGIAEARLMSIRFDDRQSIH
jgi:putative nucleotidyltransferase with HDIG domain